MLPYRADDFLRNVTQGGIRFADLPWTVFLRAFSPPKKFEPPYVGCYLFSESCTEDALELID